MKFQSSTPKGSAHRIHRRIQGTLITLILPLGMISCSPKKIDLENVSKHWKDVEYGEASLSQNLDVFLPRIGQPPYPVILYIHGGGFSAGNKYGMANPIAQASLRRGYAFVTINYRLSGEAVFPAAADDSLAALRFMRKNALAYGIDPDRIVVWGSSAGANLAAMAATKGDAKDGTGVEAAVIWFGPMEFDAMDAQFEQIGLKPRIGKTNTKRSPESRYLGVTIGTTEAADLVQRANPATYIDASDPPMFIQHGSADRNIPYLQSENFAASLSGVIGEDEVFLEVLDGADHGGDEFESPKNLEKIFSWLSQKSQ